MAEHLGIARNYVYLLESGRKPMTPKMLTKLNELDDCSLCMENNISKPISTETPPATGACTVHEPLACRIPEGYDVVAEMAHVRRELAEVRERLRQFDMLSGQLDTITRLLGASLRVPADSDTPDAATRAG